MITLTLLCLFTPKAFGVSPPPDGFYPGGNTAEGQNALFSLTSGGYNTAVGYYSLRSNTVGGFNTAIGAGALFVNNAAENTATGVGALLSNTTGPANTASGTFALLSNTIGNSNTAVGVGALFHNTTGGDNTATGSDALESNTGGIQNTATGVQALDSNTTANGNTAIGFQALLNNTTGGGNIALGVNAGSELSTGTSNIDIGNHGVAGESATIRIGTTGTQTGVYLAGIAGQTVGMGGSTCYVDNDGKLGVFLSAGRFKTDIADMATASEGLLALRPVTFHYKPELDKIGIPQFGLIAEEVAKINPELVTHDAKGHLSTVRYEAVNVMLLNEFLKEHRKVEKQEATIAEIKSNAAKQEATIVQLKSTMAQQMEAVTARLKEQDVKIQKVSAQLEVSRPASQTALNNH